MKYIAFISWGKDSLAQIIEIKRLGLPLDEAVYVDIRYTTEIDGENPLMSKWIPNAEKILHEQFGVKVKHLQAQYTFKEQFYATKKQGKYIGERYGFPHVIGAWCNSRLKMSVIQKYITSLNDDVTEYIGFAVDEMDRFIRLKRKETKKIKYRSVLVENGITEAQAFEICKRYNLLSPVYENATRGGCWFCAKQSMSDLYFLWKEYPSLFEELKRLEIDSRCTFKPNTTIPQIETRFNEGYIPKKRGKGKCKNLKKILN
jgi:hypothetical protein